MPRVLNTCREEVDAWLGMLGSTSKERVATLRNLLKHANEDGMTAEDRTICREELARQLSQTEHIPAC